MPKHSSLKLNPRNNDPGFIYIFLRSPYFKIVGEGHMTGTAGQRRLPTEYFATRPFPVPPCQEQKRIVGKVDELMALCDRLEAQQQERERTFPIFSRAAHALFAEAPSQDNLNRIFDDVDAVSSPELRRTIQSLAVQGKLVDRISTEGSGAEIINELKGGILRQENLPALPKHWAWSNLGQTILRMDSGWSPACNPEPASPNTWGVLKTTAVQELRYEEAQNKALPSNLDPRPEHVVNDGDILITRAGPMNRVGIICVARPTRSRLMISDKIIRLKLVSKIDPDFAALALNAGYSSRVIEGLKSGMAASQVNISQPKLRTVPLPLPPPAEQKRIVSKVRALMAVVDKLEAQQQNRDQLAEAFAKACVASFTGTTTLEKNEMMKAPKTELVSLVSLGKKPKADAVAPLAKLLIKQDGELSAKALWQQSGLEVDAFYHQLKSEIAQGWIVPQPAEMKIVETEEEPTYSTLVPALAATYVDGEEPTKQAKQQRKRK